MRTLLTLAVLFVLLDPNTVTAQITFTNINTGLLGLKDGAVAWGDYDNDGDLDLAISGYLRLDGDFLEYTRIYRNDAGTFVDIDAAVVGVMDGALDWGDYDHDGDLDLLLAGADLATEYITRLYRNDAGTFVDSGVSLPGALHDAEWGDVDNDGDLDVLLAGVDDDGRRNLIFLNDAGVFSELHNALPAQTSALSACWGDYDGDGDLDVLMSEGGTVLVLVNEAGGFTEIDTGVNGQLPADWADYDADGDLDLLVARSGETRIYRNDAGAFIDIGVDLPSVILGDAAWGDYDNDGLLDLLLTGPDSGFYAAVYRNDGLGGFIDFGAGVASVYSGSVAWADYDLDGDLDFVLTGSVGGAPEALRSLIYRNDGATANTPPSVPTGLTANQDDGRLILSWDPATDAETPAAALSYDLRVGTTPGGNEILAAVLRDSTVFHSRATWGRVVGRTSIVLDLDPGQPQIYSSVRTVDGACALSDFAAEVHTTGYSIDWEADWERVNLTQPILGGLPGTTRGASWGDYDDDGDPDLYLAIQGDADQLLRNDSGVFVKVTGTGLGHTGGVYCAAWGDYDNDDDLDLYLAVTDGADVLYRNDGADVFTNVTASPLGSTQNCNSVSWIDYDNDGWLDLYVVRHNAYNVLYRNHGDGTFSDVTPAALGLVEANRQAAWADHDGDGDLDVFLASSGTGDLNRLVRNDGGGVFTEVPDVAINAPGYHSVSGTWGDYDNDGDLDLYVVHFGAENHLLRNDGANGFRRQFGDHENAGEGVDATWADYDNDGDLDIRLVNLSGAFYLYRNDGSDGFTDVRCTASLTGSHGHASAIADYDGDGDLDLYVVRTQYGSLFYGNPFAPGNHWLHIDPEPLATTAIGARIRVHTGDLVQTRQVGSGAGWCSQNPETAYFGLGATTVADSVVVLWPSGRETAYTDVPVDQVLAVSDYELDGELRGRELARSLGLADEDILDANLAMMGMDGGTWESMPEAGTQCAEGDSVMGRVLLTTGRAVDGGLGDTDWGDAPGREVAVFGMRVRVPAWAQTLHFATRMISAEYEAGNPGVDRASFYFADGDDELQDAFIDTLASYCTGPVSSALGHVLDVSALENPDNAINLQFFVDEVSSSGHDSALEISWFYFSEDPLPAGATAKRQDNTAARAPIRYLVKPIFHDVSLIAGSFSYEVDLVDLPTPLPLRLSLSYNSDSTRDGVIGPRWSHSYDLFLVRLNDGRFVLKHGNAQASYFEADGTPLYEGGGGEIIEVINQVKYLYISESGLSYELFINAGTAGGIVYRPTSITDEHGNRVTLTYNGTRLEQVSYGTLDLRFLQASDRLYGITLNHETVAGLQYDAEGRLKAIRKYTRPGVTTDFEPTAFTYDDEALILTVAKDGVNELTNTWSRGRLVSQTDGAGATTTMEYWGNELTTTNRVGDATMRHYNLERRLDRVEHSDGGIVTYDYDEGGRLIAVTDALGGTTSLEYDPQGNLTRQTDPLGGVIEFGYDARDNIDWRTDQEGHTWDYAYDSNDNLTRETDPEGNQREFTYNAAGQVLTETDPRGSTMTYEYDPDTGYLVREIGPDGQTITYVRDDFGHVTSITNPSGKTSYFEYTADGRPLSQTDPLGGTVTWDYDTRGRLATKTTANAPTPALVESYTYDAAGRVASVTAGGSVTTTFGYDAEGRRTSVTDPLGRTTSYEYDEQGRETGITDAEGGVTSTGYDSCHLLNHTDPGGAYAAKQTDGLGRVTQEWDPLGNLVEYTYDGRGLLTGRINGRRQSLTFTYDDAGRLVQEDTPDGSIIHTRDAGGNATSSTSGYLYSVTRTFDKLNRLETRTDAQGRSVGYTYDAAGNLTHLTYPDATVVQYDYDDNGRLQRVTDWAGRVTQYQYTQAGDVRQVASPDSSLATLSYDSARRLVGLEDRRARIADQSVIYSAAFTLNAAGQRTSAIYERPMEPSLEDVYQRYTFQDNLLQTMDPYGYTHDADGNMTFGGWDGVPMTMGYDAHGHLTRAGSSVFAYDVDGYRVTTSLAGVVRHYVHDTVGDAPRVLVEYDDSGAVVAKYVHGLGLISREAADGRTAYYHFDADGSTVALTDDTGTVTDEYAYGPWGEDAGTLGTTENPFRYRARAGAMDDGNGLVFARTFYYAPALKRGTQSEQQYNGEMPVAAAMKGYDYAWKGPVQQDRPPGLSKGARLGSRGSGIQDWGGWSDSTWLDDLGQWMSDNPNKVAAGAVGLGVSFMFGPVTGQIVAIGVGNALEFIDDPGEYEFDWRFGLAGLTDLGLGALGLYDEEEEKILYWQPPPEPAYEAHNYLNEAASSRDSFDGRMSRRQEALAFEKLFQYACPAGQ